MAAAAMMVLILVAVYLTMLAYYFRYLNDFDGRVKEFLKRKKELIRAKHQLQKDVGSRDAMEAWLKDAKDVLEAVTTLQDNIQEKKRRLTSRLNLIQHFRLSKKIEEEERNINCLLRTYWENKFLSSSCSDPSQSLKSALTEIVKAMEDNSKSVISVCGQRGAGKTTLAGVVGKVAENYLKFRVVRLVVSQSTTTEVVQDTLAAFLKLKFKKKTEKERAEKLRLKLGSEQGILIILDDFCKELNLKSIGIPDQMRCKILLITSDTTVCSSVGSSKEIQLGALQKDEALKLLEKSLSRKITSGISEVASDVAEECKRSPLAIIILGRALRGKGLDEWKEAFRSLNSELKDGESEEVRIVYRSVKLSYDHLKDNETKKFFSLCSLFPKNDPVAPQDLIRYAWGLGIFEGIDSIEKVSKKVKGAIENLKNSFLLLEHEKEHVQMQNGVLEAALQMISKDESFLRIKDVVGLWERPNNEDLESCSAISYVASKPKKLHDEEFRSEKLQILFLGGEGCKTISNEFLQHLKALKVLALHHGLLSANALQNLTNLRALHLEHCKLNGLSSLGKLKALEILSFRGSDITKLPDEIGDLDNLRLLDLFDCQKLHRIPLNLIRKLSRLEELYFRHGSFEKWWSEEKSAEGSNPTPSDIISPSSLAIEPLKYQKSIDKLFDTKSRPSKVSVFLQNQSKEWNQTVNYLYRDHIVYHENHVVPYLVQSVKTVRVECCDKFQAVFQDGFILCGMEDNSNSLLSDLTSLELEELSHLSWIWYGQTNSVSFQNLSTVKLKNCERLKSLFSTSIAQRLEQLETLEIHGCQKLKQIIAETRDDLDVNETIHPALCFPTLTTLKITGCPALEYVFQITKGQILPKLTQLEIGSCFKLAQVFSFKDAADRGEIQVPRLENLALKNLISLKTFCSENCSIKLPSLKKFEVGACRDFGNDAMSKVIEHCRLKEFCLIKVGNQLCGEIFELPGGYVLSSMEILTLKEINKLQAIWKEPTQIVTLQNLTRLEVVKCNKLRTIFSLLHARNLLKLSHLVVQRCKDLEQIVDWDQIATSTSRLKPVYFPELKEILIEICNNLKSLFPVGIAHLPKLETFRVNRALKLKRIFIHEGEAKVKSEQAIELRFPELKLLSLEKLPGLVTISPVGYECVFPVLDTLVKKECRSLVTQFSKAESEPNVYAKTKENSLPKEENHSMLGRSATFQELPNNNGDIDWSRGMKMD
ncbi:hypothetical protein POUND7_006909 [Theobroma cacao]